MAVRSVAVVGKNNEPLYLRQFQFAESSSLDTFSDADLFGLSASIASVEAAVVASSPLGKKCSLRQQFLLNAALERLEELDGPPPGLAWRDPEKKGTAAMWVGLLYPIEQTRVYGYVTTTQIKLLVVVMDDVMPEQVDEQQAKDTQIELLLQTLHELYVEYTLNPFNASHEGKIISSRFDNGVADCVSEFDSESIGE